jgi:hypothetical protein
MKTLILVFCSIVLAFAGENSFVIYDTLGIDSVNVIRNAKNAEPLFQDVQIIKSYSEIRILDSLVMPLVAFINKYDCKDYRFWIAYAEGLQIVLVYALPFGYEKKSNGKISKIGKEGEIEIHLNKNTKKLVMLFVK